MKFSGRGLPLSAAGLQNSCDALGVSPAHLWALLTVETMGIGFLPDRRPQMLFERHVFRKLTRGRYDHAHPDISNARAGSYGGGAAEYTRLELAVQLDASAALRSASWGLGQVMGLNFRAAGYGTVEQMVEAMTHDEDAQLLAVARFVKHARLEQALQRCDWPGFARGYNGPQYKRNQYDQRLAAAYAKCGAAQPDLALRAAQAALYYLGYDPGPVDGYRGRRTRSALSLFQAKSGLRANGEFTRASAETLREQAWPV